MSYDNTYSPGGSMKMPYTIASNGPVPVVGGGQYYCPTQSWNFTINGQPETS